MSVARVGAMNWRVELQPPVGLNAEGYTTKTTVWGEIRGASGSESLQFGGTSSVGQYVVTIRYRDDIRAEWRLKDQTGRRFQVNSYTDPEGRREWLQIYCQELL